MAGPQVRLIVPRRADKGHRDRLWRFCRRSWEASGWPVVEGHHKVGPFNRSAAINRAAAGEWDVAVIIDADVLVDLDRVGEAVERAHATGRMVLPFTRRQSLSLESTQRIMRGGATPTKADATETQTYNVSTCVVVPRCLWDEVGGFDARFVGWGGEDDAFWAACRALAGVDKIDGDAWHLWHPVSKWRDHRSPLYTEAKGLADRYRGTRDADAMRALLAEDRGPDQIVLACLTTGRRSTLGDALDSTVNLCGPIGRRVLLCDGQLVRRPGWDSVRLRGGGSYTKAMMRATVAAVGSGQPWVFWLEDDFTIDEPVDLTDMQRLITAHDLMQLSLLRQPWYPDEVAAGGVIEAKPQAFRQMDGYVEHRDYWTCNPNLSRRRTLATYPWPNTPGSERAFGDLIFADKRNKAGIFGRVGDPPRVTHHGTKRAGKGY
jgi:hypothetical protein